MREPAHALQQAIAARSGPVSLAFIDIVGLSDVNRHLGEASGDTLLRTFEDRLRSYATRSERVWRLGGDEYMLLMPDTSARASARRVRTLYRRMSRECAMVATGHLHPLRFRAGRATSANAIGTAEAVYVAAAQALQRTRGSRSTDVVWS